MFNLSKDNYKKNQFPPIFIRMTRLSLKHELDKIVETLYASDKIRKK